MMDLKNIFLDDYFLKWSDRPLDKSEKFSVSCQIPIEMRDLNIDFNSQVNSVILNEMRITIVKNITKQMINNNNFLYFIIFKFRTCFCSVCISSLITSCIFICFLSNFFSCLLKHQISAQWVAIQQFFVPFSLAFSHQFFAYQL